MISRIQRWSSIGDVTLFPPFILWFIWQLQFTARWTWMIFILWILASVLIHRDTPKTLGWRADNLWPATRQGLALFAVFIAVVCAIGLGLGALHHLPEHLIDRRRF